jgi:hypothetical protein
MRRADPLVRSRTGVACTLLTANAHAHGENAMNTFAPEFAQLWLPGTPALAPTEPAIEAQDDEADREKAALEELADRVTAARCVI